MKKRSKGIILSYLHMVVNMVCGLVLSAFFLRVLGNTEYGVYQTIASFANYLILLEFGMGTVMVRNISLYRGRAECEEALEKTISTIWIMTCGLSIVIALFSILFYGLIPSIYARSMRVEQIEYARKIFVFITGCLIVSFLNQTLNGTILAFESYVYPSVQSIVRVVLRLALMLIVLPIYRSALLIAVIDLMLGLGCLAVSLIFCRKKLKLKLFIGEFDWEVVRSAWPLAMAVFLQSIVNQANNNVDKFLIGILQTPENAAVYSVPLYIFSIFSALTAIPISMYAPAVVNAVGRGIKGGNLVEELVPPCRLTAMIGGLVLFGFVAVGRQFINVVYGSEYLIGWILAIVLMVPMYINMVNGIIVNVLDALNKRMVRSVTLLLTTIMNIVLTVFWLKRWGMLGAALATAVCTTIGQVLLMNLYYQNVLQIPVLRLFCGAFRGILLPLLAGCAAAYGLGKLFSDHLVSFLICGVVFVGVSMVGYVLFGMTEKERNMIRTFLRRRNSA